MNHGATRPTSAPAAPTDPRSPEALARASRRRFLTRVGLGSAALGVSAAAPGAVAWAQGDDGGGDDGAEAGGSGGGEAESALGPADEAQLLLLASLGRASTDLLMTLAERGLLAAGPENAARLFSEHHLSHATAVETFLAELVPDLEVPVEASPALVADFGARIEEAVDPEELLAVALELSEGIAATYQQVMEQLEDREAAGVVATLAPISAQHAVVLAQHSGAELDAPESSDANYLPVVQDTDAAFDAETYGPGGSATAGTGTDDGTTSTTGDADDDAGLGTEGAEGEPGSTSTTAGGTSTTEATESGE
jgi:hypothetical protein